MTFYFWRTGFPLAAGEPVVCIAETYCMVMPHCMLFVCTQCTNKETDRDTGGGATNNINVVSIPKS